MKDNNITHKFFYSGVINIYLTINFKTACMKRYLYLTCLKRSVLIIASGFFTISTLSAQQREVTLSGFNADVIADSGLNQTDPTLLTSLPLDAFPGDVLFEHGYSNNTIPYANGLPGNRQISSPSGHHFQLGSYNDSNDLRLGEFDFGTIVFSDTDKIPYDSLFILATSVGGAASVNYLLLFTDNSSTSGTLTISDWTCVGCTNYAINNVSTIDRTSGTVSGTNRAIMEYAIPVPAAVAAKQVYGFLFRVDITELSVANIFAVTGIPLSALPVSLVYYNAQVKDGSALLQWKTAQELNNKTYVIERAGSTFPDVFVQVGTVPATSSANGSVYSFTNTPGISGTYLYRLTQVDVDGKKEVLGIRSITINGKATWTVQDLGTQWRLTSADAFTYRLIDMNGRVLKAGTGSAGATTISKPSAMGIYVIQVFANGELSTQKVIH
jgi:hypothetical protein